jgi:hypothetical protein
LSSSVKTKLTNVQTVTLETLADPNTQVSIGSISGSQVKLFPIESNSSQYVNVYNKVTQVQVGDQLQNRRSVAIDLTTDIKNKISNVSENSIQFI